MHDDSWFNKSYMPTYQSIIPHVHYIANKIHINLIILVSLIYTHMWIHILISLARARDVKFWIFWRMARTRCDSFFLNPQPSSTIHASWFFFFFYYLCSFVWPTTIRGDHLIKIWRMLAISELIAVAPRHLMP